MLGKILGILLLVAGGLIALSFALTLISGILHLTWFLIKVVGALVILYVGYRLVTRDSDY